MSYTPLDDLNRGKLRTVPSASEDEEQSHRSSSRRDSGTRSALSEPLTSNGQADEDPFYVFREDLYRKLEHVDESLAEYLRIVHQTVSLRGTATTKRESYCSRPPVVQHVPCLYSPRLNSYASLLLSIRIHRSILTN